LDVRAAVRAGDVRLQFQPEFDLASRSLLAVEALARWHDPQSGVRETESFIGIAEENGEIVEFGDWALRTACAQYAGWRAQFPSTGLVLRVNASPLQLSQPAFAGTVAQVLAEHAMHPADLCIEVTEVSTPSDAAVMGSSLRALRASGVRIALDDFGTGRNGLWRLRHDFWDMLKIDRGFVGELSRGTRDSVILEAVVTMARALGLDIVAEGIETETALAELQRIGVRRGQGYLLGAPADATTIGALLAEAS